VSRFKRSFRGRWVTLPPAAASKREREALFERRTSLMKRAEESESADPVGSWFGSVQAGLPGEEWPEYEGVPMLPLCQLRCEEISALPSMLNNLALICVFTAFVGEEALSPEGERWVVRAYESLVGLVPIAYPGDTGGIRAYPIRWQARVDSPHDQAGLPETLWMDFAVYRDYPRNIFKESKVGGYPSVGRSKEPLLDKLQTDFVFQTVIQGDFPWLRGPGGTLVFSYAYEYSGNRWSLAWESLSLTGGKRGKDIRIGCEIEGMQLYIESPEYGECVGKLAMCYLKRTGRVYHLSDLCGLVHITTGDMALQFVRLRTHGIVYDRKDAELEVFMETEYAAWPEWYRVEDWRYPDTSRRKYRTVEITETSRRNVFDPESFRKLGFESACVEAIESGFRVVRWTYGYPLWMTTEAPRDKNPQGTYQKIAETVAYDGAYTRAVLEQCPAPDRELLRPASGPGQTDPSELLRPRP